MKARNSRCPKPKGAEVSERTIELEEMLAEWHKERERVTCTTYSISQTLDLLARANELLAERYDEWKEHLNKP